MAIIKSNMVKHVQNIAVHFKSNFFIIRNYRNSIHNIFTSLFLSKLFFFKEFLEQHENTGKSNNKNNNYINQLLRLLL